MRRLIKEIILYLESKKNWRQKMSEPLVFEAVKQPETDN